MAHPKATRDDYERETMNESDFDLHGEILPGLEHLGRAITDENGVPSGSPANYENLRGKTGNEISDADKQRILDDLAAEFPKEG